MTRPMRSTLLAILAAALLPAAAQAQHTHHAHPAPLYPYAVAPGQPYAVEVAPNTYVIQRPAQSRAYPYVHCVNGCRGSAPVAVRQAAPRREVRRTVERQVQRRTTRNDPAAIEELHRRHGRTVKREVVNTTRIVREKPVVIEHQRVVDDPPRVIERHHYVEHAPAAPAARRARPAKVATADEPPRAAAKRKSTTKSETKSGAKGEGARRVIRAEAEVTILGPDRMNIRLFRKGGAGARAEAEAD